MQNEAYATLSCADGIRNTAEACAIVQIVGLLALGATASGRTHPTLFALFASTNGMHVSTAHVVQFSTSKEGKHVAESSRA